MHRVASVFLAIVAYAWLPAVAQSQPSTGLDECCNFDREVECPS
jgi:hypothetical protein